MKQSFFFFFFYTTMYTAFPSRLKELFARWMVRTIIVCLSLSVSSAMNTSVCVTFTVLVQIKKFYTRNQKSWTHENIGLG